MIYHKLYQYLTQKALFDRHQKVLIALSGGVDSMNLLHFLHLYRQKFNIEIGIAHVNHKQRLESETEEHYIRQWASDNNIPLFIAYFTGTFSEKNARDFRYQFFKQIMSEEGYTATVTAHHADDQAETLLMKLIRGSRLRHFIGIKEVQTFGDGELIRPFLTVTKAELPKIFHFEDCSNESNQYFRNRVRQTYLPAMTLENPQFSKHLIHFAEENHLLQEALSDLVNQIEFTNLDYFQQQGYALQTVLLQHYLTQFPKLQISKAQFNQVLAFLQKKGGTQLPLKSGYYLQKGKEHFAITKISPETDSTLEVKVLKYQKMLTYRGIRFHFKDEGEGIAVPSLSSITLRGRLPGDRIDFGTFSKKVRRLFIDDKIPIENREQAIIGEQDGEILFIYTDKNLYLRKSSESDTMKAILVIEKIEEW